MLASNACRACEAREKKPILSVSPQSRCLFSASSRPFVWLLARTWIRKNTDCFAVYIPSPRLLRRLPVTSPLSVALPTSTTWTLRSNWSSIKIDDALFWHVCLEQNNRPAFMFFWRCCSRSLSVIFKCSRNKRKSKELFKFIAYTVLGLLTTTLIFLN